MKPRIRSTIALAAAATLAVVATLLVYFWWSRSATPRYPGANVLLVTIDTLRADHLGAYGYETAETPRLDRLAREGIRFEQVVSAMPLTLPSHTSIMTSETTQHHGVRDNAAFTMAPETRTLAESLSAAGYDAGAFVGSFVLHSRWGLNRGFSHYDDRFDYEQPGGIPGQVERRAEAVVDAALPWLRESRDRPFFAWVHVYDPHSPYSAPEPWPGRFPGHPYDAEIAYTDSQIGRLLDQMESAGLLDNTVVVVTADHGEGLGEHGEPGHGMFLYDTTLLVPLIIHLPDGIDAGRAVPEQVRLIDVAPTILDLVGVAAPESFDGETLTPFFNGDPEALPAYSETYYPRWHFGWQDLHALRKDGYKYILAPKEELYDVRDDPGETRNLANDDPVRTAALQEEVEGLAAEGVASDPGRLTGEAASRLRALGYIGSAPVDVGEGPLPDPKDKIDLFVSTSDAQGMLVAGEFAQAVDKLRGVVAEDPRITSAWVTLGNALFRLARFGEAADAFKEALALNPEDDLALANLGMAHRRLGDLETARADFEAVLALDPRSTSAHFNLGEMAIEAGDPVAAQREFAAAARIDDQLPGPHFGLGVAAYQRGELDRAAEEFERVREVAPLYLELDYYRALLAEAHGDIDGAEKLYRSELEHNPHHHRSWFNLSQIQAQRGDHRAAVESLRQAIEAEPERAPAHVMLARSLLALESPADYAEIEAEARRGLALDPPATLKPLAHFVLADLYNRMGRPADAQREAALGREAQRAIGG